MTPLSVFLNSKHVLTYTNETSINSLPKSLINYVTFSSGRKENITERIDIDGPEGWRNVLITNNPDDVIGLVRLGEINAKASNAAGVLSASGVDSRATEKIKKEASILGAHIILAQQNATRGSSYGTAAKSFKSGVAYGYPFRNVETNTSTVGGLARRFYALQKARGGVAEPAIIEGQKVVFEVDGIFYEGEIVKRYGNFYKVKYINEQGKVDTTSKHIEKVAFVDSKWQEELAQTKPCCQLNDTADSSPAPGRSTPVDSLYTQPG